MTAVDSCHLQYNKSNFQWDAKWKAHPGSNEEVTPSKKYTRRCLIKTSAEKEQCFFCGKPAIASEPLRHASTFGLDTCVRQCALQLQDQGLWAKLSEGYLIALEAKYHALSVFNITVQQSQTIKTINQLNKKTAPP